MSVNIKIKPNTKKNNKETDTVLFMSAYDIHKFSKNFPRMWRNRKNKNELQQFHILGITTKDRILTRQKLVEYTEEKNLTDNYSEFKFNLSDEEYTNEIEKSIDEMFPSLMIHHASKNLLDENKVNFSFCFNMESFLVSIKSEIFQVDSLAYIINGVLIVTYELIHYNTGKPLCADEILGRSNNFNIIPVQSVGYFGNENLEADDRKISDIIFFNVWEFMESLTKNKFKFDTYSFAHNILVFTNNIQNPKDFFQKVLDASIPNIEVENISTTYDFNYYSKEYLGLVTCFSKNNFQNILFDIQILESFKVFLLLKMIVDMEIKNKLKEIIDNQFYLKYLCYQAHAPIITSNLIEAVKHTDSYKQYKSAIEFKIDALKTYQERKQTSNGRLLNILLYLLALIGSFQTLQVLQTELGFSFKIGVALVCSFFGLFGVIWIWREFKNKI